MEFWMLGALLLSVLYLVFLWLTIRMIGNDLSPRHGALIALKQVLKPRHPQNKRQRDGQAS